MANTLDLLRTRLRASGTTGIADALMYQVLSACQEMYNAVEGRVLSSATPTLAANTTVYSIRSTLTSPVGIRIVSIRTPLAYNAGTGLWESKTMMKLDDWRELEKYDRDWYATYDDDPVVWSQIGADLFALYPGPNASYAPTIYYVGETTTLDDSGDSFEVPGEEQDIVYSFAEVIFHLHMRNYPEAKAKIKELGELLGIELPGSEIN